MKKELIKEIEKERDKTNYKILFLNMLFESESTLIIKNMPFGIKYIVGNNSLMNLFDLYKNAGLFRKVYKGESI
jgi:hypothetical protein